MTDPLRYIRKAIKDALPGIAIYDMIADENGEPPYGVVNLANYTVDDTACNGIVADIDVIFFDVYGRKGGSLTLDQLMDQVLTLFANGETWLTVENFSVDKCTIVSSQSDGVLLFNRMMYRRQWRINLILTEA